MSHRHTQTQKYGTTTPGLLASLKNKSSRPEPTFPPGSLGEAGELLPPTPIPQIACPSAAPVREGATPTSGTGTRLYVRNKRDLFSNLKSSRGVWEPKPGLLPSTGMAGAHRGVLEEKLAWVAAETVPEALRDAGL